MKVMSSKGSYYVSEADLVVDREAILRIWRQKVSGTPLSEDKLAWFYENNPAGKGRVFLLFHLDHVEPVGAVGIVPRKFVGNGVSLVAGLIIDFVVLPDHRTLGPGLMLQRAAIDAVGAHVDFTLSFPNKMSRILRERLGYDLKQALGEYVCPIALEHYLSRQIPSPIRGILALANRAYLSFTWRMQKHGSTVQVDYSPEFVDRLWRRATSGQRIAGLRDSLTINWRLKQHPSSRIDFFCIKSARSDESGYIAFTISEDRKVNVVDALADNVRLLRILYACFLVEMATQNAVSVALRVEQGELFDPGVLRLGFQKRGEKLVYCARTSRSLAITSLREISVSGFDGDS